MPCALIPGCPIHFAFFAKWVGKHKITRSKTWWLEAAFHHFMLDRPVAAVLFAKSRAHHWYQLATERRLAHSSFRIGFDPRHGMMLFSREVATEAVVNNNRNLRVNTGLGEHGNSWISIFNL